MGNITGYTYLNKDVHEDVQSQLKLLYPRSYLYKFNHAAMRINHAMLDNFIRNVTNTYTHAFTQIFLNTDNLGFKNAQTHANKQTLSATEIYRFFTVVGHVHSSD